MKKIFLLLSLVVTLTTHVQAEENISADKKSTLIYEKCVLQAPEATAVQPILGNIEDIARERSIRNCLKKDIMENASKSLSKNSITDLEVALSNAEKSLFDVYKALIFCQNNEDNTWCNERYKDDMSLEKLMLEKELTSLMKNILTAVFEYQQEL